jgi:hypothetical protein
MTEIRHPLVVSYGAGVDSTAMLIAMHERGIRPDLILFADTGGEKPETYEYLTTIDAWLERVGFPAVTTVRYEPVRAPYHTLEEKCLANEALPSLAYPGPGHHSCSLVFKVEPQNKFLKTWPPALEAWAAGRKVTKAIGYDNGSRDCARRAKADRATYRPGNNDAKKYEMIYPLQEWGIDREAAARLIEAAGLPVPVKSACFFCPAMKIAEVLELQIKHPDLFARALKIESVAKHGKHGFKSPKTKGLGLGTGCEWAELGKTINDNEPDLFERREAA